MRPILREPLIRLFLLHGAFGALIGVLLAAVLAWADVQGLGHLFGQSLAGRLGLAMLAASFAFTFAGAAIATAVMLLPPPAAAPPDGPDRRRDRLVPILLPARKRRRDR